MILGDIELRAHIKDGRLGIDPLSEDTIRENGLDLRIGDTVFEFIDNGKPIKVGEQSGKNVLITDKYIVKPHGRSLLVTKEYIKMPKDVMAFCNLRSTFARTGLSIPPTVVDAGFEGQLTIELIGSAVPVIIEKDIRFLHLIFAKTTEIEKPYKGKYQQQRGITHAKRD